MIKKINFFAVVLLLVVHLHAVAQSVDVCNDDYKVFNQTQIQTGTLGPKVCYISVDPFNNLSLVFRSYIFVNDSSLMIFNSYGDGPSASYTGARELFFFPRSAHLNYASDALNLNINFSGIHFAMNPAIEKFVSIDGVSFQEDPAIVATNNGGIAILSSQRLYLDLGFKMGGAPRANSSASSTFHDSAGISCDVLNSEVLDYSHDAQNPVFKFASDSDLSQFLKIRCPQLSFILK